MDQTFSFIKQLDEKQCLNKLKLVELEELFAAGNVYIKNDRLKMNVDRFGNITIFPSGLCNELKAVKLRYYTYLDQEFIFVYRRFTENRDSYGQLQLYIKKDSIWQAGQILQFGWQHLFQISEKEIKRLNELNQYPQYMIEFKENGIEISIPWELYSFDEGTEINGYSQGRGKQPILLQFDEIIPR
jgi:hypothetical protein